MILELDVGNTRIKWRQIVADHGTVIEEGVVPDLDTLISGPLAEKRPEMLRFCCVRGNDLAEKISQFCAVTWGREAQQAVVKRHCAGVTNQYQDLSRLGIDRWLAMIAAYNRRQQACVIVDSGTAFTIDAVDGQGRHLGGYILPGWRMMTDALQDKTQIRLQGDACKADLQLGHGTEAAVCNGTLAALVALVEKVKAAMQNQNEEPLLYLAGGDARVLAEQLDTTAVEIVSGLVLDGLAYACPAVDTQVGE